MTILDDILAHKRDELRTAKARISEKEMEARAQAIAEPSRGFRRALAVADPPAIIAEIKRRSPSKGEIRPNFDPVACAKAYARGGAAALSILTDERFFGGRLEHLSAVRQAVSLPLLRKDFTIEPYQVDEAKVAGADAILLIVAALEAEDLASLRARALSLGLDVIVEVHDAEELEVALEVGVDLLGVNNRNLKTFETRLEVTEALAARLPASGEILLVSESGIQTPDDIARLQKTGAAAFLVGESLMRQPDPGSALTQLRRKP